MILGCQFVPKKKKITASEPAFALEEIKDL